MTENKTHSEDQIDLPSFKTIIFQVFGLWFSFLSYCGRVIRKSKPLLVAGFICGLLIGYLLHVIRPTRYEAAMTVQYGVLTRQTYAEILEQLNSVLSSQPPTAFASALSVKPEITAGIGYLETENMDGLPLAKDTSTRLDETFRIIVGLSGNINPDSIQSALTNYLNGLPYLKKNREVIEQTQKDKLVFIDRELTRLDTLKSGYNHLLASSREPRGSASSSPSSFSSAPSSNMLPDPADVFVHSDKLMNEKAAILKALSDQGPISVINGLKTIRSSHSLRLSTFLAIGGALGFLLAFLIGLLNLVKKSIEQA